MLVLDSPHSLDLGNPRRVRAREWGLLSFSQSPVDMSFASAKTTAQESGLGQQLHDFITQLYPLCRSITGDGLRETLRRIREQLPLQIHEVSSGTKVFDWTVPKEWNIRDAYVMDSRGQRVIDFRKSNLHVVSYSIPVRQKLSLGELRNHLHTLPEHPDWIPYRTSYYKEDWGFCLRHNQLLQMKDEEYEVYVDSSLNDGSLSYGEFYKQGASEDEVLISTHACHPSLCNDNLSGLAVAVFLARHLRSLPTRYSYRFLFLPVTIGAITWLARNENRVGKIKHGLILTCLGDSGRSTYKKSRRATAEIDRVVEHVLRHSGQHYNVLEFSPLGYDERQFSSPAFDLPVGCLMRTPNGRFPEYHTSADNLDFVKPFALADSLGRCLEIVNVLEKNLVYWNRNPKCEPQLGRRGLYRALGGQQDQALLEQALLWVLNFSDGRRSLLEIADRASMPFGVLQSAAELLLAHELLETYPPHSDHPPFKGPYEQQDKKTEPYSPTLGEQRQFWDWHWQHREERKAVNEWTEGRARVILDFLRSLGLKQPLLLDLGCGTGWFTERLAQVGQATGVDLSEEAIGAARSRRPEINYICGNLYEAPLPQKYFDVVVSQEVIAHVEDQGRYIDLAADVLKPGGYLILTTGNRFVIDHLGNAGWNVQPPQHIGRHLNMRDVRNLLRRRFRILRTRSILPMGNAGILRLVNSCTLNAALGRLIPSRHLQSLKERAGLGYHLIALARRKS